MSSPRRKPAPSGRFLLRLDPGLHGALRAAACEAGVSLNDYCARRLAAPGGPVPDAGATDTVSRAAAVAGAALVGVVVFGSWTRGDAADSSDIDVLVIVGRSVRLSRALYARWDEQRVVWEGRPVEPHFAHLPEVSERVSGLWAEIATDGIVLFERGVLVSQLLGHVRRGILGGRLVRRFVHGQPYWTEVA